MSGERMVMDLDVPTDPIRGCIHLVRPDGAPFVVLSVISSRNEHSGRLGRGPSKLKEAVLSRGRIEIGAGRAGVTLGIEESRIYTCKNEGGLFRS
jgi:hypothetical protein